VEPPPHIAINIITSITPIITGPDREIAAVIQQTQTLVQEGIIAGRGKPNDGLKRNRRTGVGIIIDPILLKHAGHQEIVL
jgi:hypothetical protein